MAVAARVALLLCIGSAHASYYYNGGGGGGGFAAPVPCTSCSAACQAFNTKQLSVSKEPCYEDTWSSGSWCSTDCNNAECGRQQGVCTIDDALFTCTKVDAAKKFLKKPSTQYLNAAKLMDTPITMKFGQVKLTTTNGLEPTKVSSTLSVNIKWSDQRLDPNAMPGLNGLSVNASLVACRDVVSLMLKIPSGVAWIPGQMEQQTVETYYWLPRVQPANPAGAHTVANRDFSYDATDKRATLQTKMAASFDQGETESDTPYFGFPFDVQTVYMRLEAKPTVQMVGCNSTWSMSTALSNTGKLDTAGLAPMADAGKLDTYSIAEMSKLLPASGDWKFDTVEIDGPQVSSYVSGTDTCVIKIRMRRNPTVYILKAFLPDLIVMCIGMASLFINPQIPPLFGGRCSILIISMLITMNGSLNRNNGLGKLSYLLKIDFVALGNLIMLLTAMFCSIVIHQCFRFKLDRLGVLLDRAVRISLPSIIFPGVQVFEFMLLANDTATAPVTFLVVYLAIAFTGIISYFLKQHWDDRAKIRAMSRKLKTLSLDDPNAANILRDAFLLFDADGSGALDAKEGRKLLKVVNPMLSREMVAQAIRSADQNGNGIVEDDFQDMILKWAATKGETLEEGEATTTGVDVQVDQDLKA